MKNMSSDSGVLLNFRDSPDVVNQIEELVMRGIFPSRSECLRAAVGELLEQYAVTSNAKKVTINVPNKMLEWALINLIAPGYDLNMESLLNRLLKEHIQNKLAERQRMEERKKEILRKRSELQMLEDEQEYNLFS